MQKIIAALMFSICLPVFGQIFQGGGGSIRPTNAPFAGALLTTDGTKFYWATPTNLQAVATNAIAIQSGAGNATTLTNPTLRTTASVAGHLTVSSNATVSGSMTVTNGDVHLGHGDHVKIGETNVVSTMDVFPTPNLFNGFRIPTPGVQALILDGASLDIGNGSSIHIGDNPAFGAAASSIHIGTNDPIYSRTESGAVSENDAYRFSNDSTGNDQNKVVRFKDLENSITSAEPYTFGFPGRKLNARTSSGENDIGFHHRFRGPATNAVGLRALKTDSGHTFQLHSAAVAPAGAEVGTNGLALTVTGLVLNATSDASVYYAVSNAVSEFGQKYNRHWANFSWYTTTNAAGGDLIGLHNYNNAIIGTSSGNLLHLYVRFDGLLVAERDIFGSGFSESFVGEAPLPNIGPDGDGASKVHLEWTVRGNWLTVKANQYSTNIYRAGGWPFATNAVAMWQLRGSETNKYKILLDSIGSSYGDEENAVFAKAGQLRYDDSAIAGNLLATTPTFQGLVDWADSVALGGSGAVATDTIWNVAGDTVYGTGSDTASRLGIGTAGQFYQVNAGATAPQWSSFSSDITVAVGGAATIANGAITDAKVTSITTRSKLPSAIAYEDEANTFSAQITLNGNLQQNSGNAVLNNLSVNGSVDHGIINNRTEVTAVATNDSVLIRDASSGLTAQSVFGNFPISGPQQTALDLKAPLISPSFTTPTLGVATATTLNTGFGANELYAMDQNVRTTDPSTNAGITVNGSAIMNREVIVPIEVGVTGSVKATNGPAQIYTLGSHTNLNFEPLSGSDATNSIPIIVVFTQNSTGGFFPTNNGAAISINTNPSTATPVSYSIVNGRTNVVPAVSISLTNPANLQEFVWDSSLYALRNVTPSGGSGTVTATGGSLTANAVVLGAGTTDIKVVAGITTDGTDKLTLGSVDFGGNTDTTIARSSAGNVSVEGNVIYRAGGTDVPVADGGTGISSGTSGGIPYFSGSTTMASSAALADRELVVGGGAGAAPSAAGVTIPVSGVVSNVTQIKFKATASPAITTSNLVINFNTNRYFLTGLTNAIFTNIVEESTSALDTSDVVVFIKNTTGVSMGLVWPAYGAQHGYFFRTNANNPIISTTTLASGALGVATFTVWPDGTNLSATFTTWP